jgi:hypothetical protein
MASFSTIQTRVSNLVGANVAISSTEIQQIIQAEHDTILGDNSWADRKKQGTITTAAPYTTGTIAVSGTTVTGDSTVFTSAMVGRWIRPGTEAEYYKITAFGGVTSLTIETAISNTIAAGTGYSIFQHIYALPSDAERITSIASLYPIVETSRQDIDRWDPYRSTTEDHPTHYAYAELSSTNIRQIEFWPTPAAAALIRFQYLKTNTLSDGADVPLYRSDVLVWKSAASCAFLLYAKTGDDNWMQLADRYTIQYDRSLTGARLDDIGKNSPAHKIRDVYGYQYLSGDYNIDHDIGPTW